MRRFLLSILLITLCSAAFADDLRSGAAAAGGVSNPIEISGSSSSVRLSFTETVSSLTATFNYTGSAQTWVVPNHVYAAQFTVVGASGAAGWYGGIGGSAGKVVTSIPLVPGETVNIYVGGPGGAVTAGFNGGAAGADQTGQKSGGGGGASDVRRGGSTLAARWIVAGGGGGGGNDSTAPGHGGDGGGLISERGDSDGAGFAATQSSGGAGGTTDGAAGTFGKGGAGTAGTGFGTSPGGGGGGGWFGGGGGGYDGSNKGGGGAGGSSYSRGYNTTHTQGNGLAPAYVQITYPASPVTTWQVGVSSNGSQFQISNSSEGLQTKARLTVNDQGFIGVNTSTPEARLHVDQGDVLITGGKLYLRRGLETASPPFDPSFAPLGDLDVVGGTIMVRGGGGVIIGTTSQPTSALDVFNGSITVRGANAGIGINGRSIFTSSAPALVNLTGFNLFAGSGTLTSGGTTVVSFPGINQVAFPVLTHQNSSSMTIQVTQWFSSFTITNTGTLTNSFWWHIFGK